VSNELTFAVVVAHPDDDAYGFAGSVAKHADDPGFRFVLIHATDGGGGDIRDGFPATRETLGRIRQAEDEDGWWALGREPDRHVWMGYTDGEVDQVPFDELVDAVGAILDEEQPTVVGTFGPDGIFAHPDHIAIGAATDAAFLRSAATSGRAFRRLLHGAIPQSVFERWQEQRAAKGLELFDPTHVYHMRGVPDDEIGLVIDCRDVAHRIVAGLMEHRSQHHVMFDYPVDAERWERVVSRDWATIAWPERTASAPLLTDIFEGLP
ncbi:PIG-L deacetylase family protein, partial [Aeromicrobium sp.]|uniref:PIG-L deacetylase family protein n=1 Tax=Aeromicrobium sp. TaxID=1871063 RepID=UPI003D6B47C7